MVTTIIFLLLTALWILTCSLPAYLPYSIPLGQNVLFNVCISWANKLSLVSVIKPTMQKW